ncbi:hypothetical protein CDIK_4040 [Cucumispora dikerogammari]|nr:hypothetical protein CDIK_4040 [Cucumispora dikerogammari]
MLYVIGDNCSTNKSIATKVGIPLIGCYSHKLNLAVQKYLSQFSSIDLVHKLMTMLFTPLNLEALREKTTLKPIVRSTAKWTSCYNMLTRFLQIKDFIDQNDVVLVEFLPSSTDIFQLQEVMISLQPLNELTIYLQNESLNLADAKKCFDSVLIKHSGFEHYLSKTSVFFNAPDFDAAVIKIINGEEDKLSYLKKMLIEKGKVQFFSICVNKENSFIPTVAKHPQYINLKFIPPTSNLVERLFSLAGRIYCARRKSLNCET